MTPCVLLKGYLDRIAIESAIRQITTYWHTEDTILLAFDSEGGNVSPAIEFIDFLKSAEKNGLKIGMWLYNVKSVAAAIAFSAGSRRDLNKKSIVEFHRGSLQLEAPDFDQATGLIKPEIIDQFNKYHTLLLSILEQHGINKDQKMMAELYGSNWLKLDASKCLELGMINDTFFPY